MDDFSWGNTRQVVGEGNQKTVLYDDDEIFTDDMIPYKSFKGQFPNSLYSANIKLKSQTMKPEHGKLNLSIRRNLVKRNYQTSDLKPLLSDHLDLSTLEMSLNTHPQPHYPKVVITGEIHHHLDLHTHLETLEVCPHNLHSDLI